MVKKIFPIIFIFFVWLIFAKPFFLDNKIPYPSDYQVNHFDLWATYPKYWSAVKNPAMPDVISEMMPWKKLTIESFKEGNIPFWNPYSFSGTPHLANYQSGVFGVTNLFYFILHFNNAWALSVLIQPLLAGIFMYLFIRSLKLGNFSAVIASLSFMFCGFITTWMSYTTLALAISFLPLSLFAIEKYIESKHIKFLLLLSLTFPLSFFSGHFQISIYFALFVFAYIFFKFIENKNKKDFFRLLTFSLLGILFSSPQLFPSIELYLQAIRGSIFQRVSAVPLIHLPTIIAPDFYGNPVTRNDFLGIYAEYSSFLGVIPFLLGIFAIFKKSSKVYFFLIAATVSLLFSLNTPIADFLVWLKIPVLSTSALSRILILFSFSFATLSTFGLEKLIEDLKNQKYRHIRIWVIICLLIFVSIWSFIGLKLVNPLFLTIAPKNMILPTLIFVGLILALFISIFRKKLITIAIIILVLLTAFDMLRFAIKWQPFESKELVFPGTPVISKLKSLDNTYRTLGPFVAEGSVYYHIPNTNGYDPLYINRYGEFLESLNDRKIKSSGRVGTSLPQNGKYLPKVIDLLGIKYVLIKTKDLNKPWVLPIKQYPKDKFELIYKEKDFLLFKNNNVFPRAFLVENIKVLNKDQEIINQMLDDNFDLRNSAVIEKDINLNNSIDFKGNASIIKYLPNEVEIDTSSNADSLLILTDNYYPGWKAEIDGKQTEILRTDYTFRGILVPEGRHKVKFYFNSDSFRWGMYLAAISTLSIFIVLIGKWYTKNTK